MKIKKESGVPPLQSRKDEKPPLFEPTKAPIKKIEIPNHP